MLDQMVRDYTNNIREAEAAVAQTIGNLRLLEKDHAEDVKTAQEWGTKALAASMAVFMSVSQLSVPAFAAEGTKSVSIAGSTYTYSAEALEGYTQIGNSGLYYR